MALDEPDGLLAFGGDLSIARLLLAYQSGIFPWFSQNEPIMWWSPSQRGVLPLRDFHCSKSLKKLIRKNHYRISLNQDFEQVIQLCANIPRMDNGTWITDSMIQAYQRLHQHGHAHSIEVWQQNELVGGLYGVSVGRVFCGESMFHLHANCSKLAMFWLVHYLQLHQFDFIDCQMITPHLATMGGIAMPRKQFIDALNLSVNRQDTLPDDIWSAKVLNG